MKEEVKIAWVKALRSKEFEQCTFALCKVDSEGHKSFCCLGVLCTLAEEAGVTRGLETQDDNLGTIVHWDDAKDVLPRRIQDWAGLCSHVGKRPGGTETSLAIMNDQGFSFESIASIIEEEGHAL